jgi:hypothetical protein
MSGLYPTSGVDSRQISPADAAVTLRSLPRRFASELATPDDDRPDEVVHRRPPGGGLSAIEHSAWVASGLPRLGQALHQVLFENDPVIEVPPLVPVPPLEHAHRSVPETVEAIAANARPLADVIDGVDGDDWLRPATLNGQKVTALDVAHGAVQLGIYHLRAIERTLREVAGDIR